LEYGATKERKAVMKTTIRLMSEFVVGAIIAFIIILLASCEEAKAVVTVNTNLLPPMPPVVTVHKKTANLSAGTSSVANNTSSASSAATQNDAQPLIIIPPPKTNYVFPAIGTLQKVTDYAVQNITVIGIYAWVYETNGSEIYYGGTTWYKGTNVVTSKTQLDQQIIVPGLSNVVLYNVCTNTDPTLDKSKGVVISVACQILTPGGYLSQSLLWYYNTIQLVKISDGSYSVPDLLWFSTSIGSPMPFYVPSLQWARLEVGSNGFSSPFEVDDNLYKSGTSPLSSDGFLYLQTSYITNSASSGGSLWIKTTLFDGTNVFQIFNGDGNIVPETPLKLAISTNIVNDLITATKGDSGRGFVLQSSTNLAMNVWVNCSSTTFVSPTNGVPELFNVPSTNNCSFFRAAIVSVPPTN
jgi:hypothetical protein